MPMDKSRYPTNWNEIAKQVKEESGWKCEECGVEHGRYIVRNPSRPEKFRYVEAVEARRGYLKKQATLVVLTVHHIGIDYPDGSPGDPNDKMDCRRENLIALCQKCHLDADRENNIKLSQQTRINTKVEAARDAGQMEMFCNGTER